MRLRGPGCPARALLLQIKQGVDVGRDCEVLRGELFGGRGGGAGHGAHGAGHVGDWYALVLEGVDRGVGKFADGASAGAGEGVGGVAGAAIGVFDCFVLGFVNIFESVVQGLGFAHVGFSELLGEGSDLGKVLELESDVGGDAVADELLLGGAVVVYGLNGKESDVGGFGF